MIERLRILISQIFFTLLVGLLAVSRSAWPETAPLVGPVLFLLSAVCVGIAALGRLWCSLYIAGYKTDRLITAGPYSMCRNPLYFFSFIGAIGVGLATETVLVPLAIALAFAIYYPLVIKSEETQLLRLHEAAFVPYMESVPRFFPRISALREPEQYVVRPKIFREHIYSALWFVWLLGIMELIKALHDLRILPSLIQLY